MTGAVQHASQLQEDAGKLGAGSAEGQAKSRFGASSGAVQDVIQLQEDAGKFGAGSAGRHANGRFEASLSAVQKATFGSMGWGPRARSVLHCHGVLALQGGSL